jgi:DNA-binding XRE family transcriptional regulator
LAHVEFRVTAMRRSTWPPRPAAQDPVQRCGEAAAKALGTRVRQLRNERGWSQEHLAELANIHRTYMWGIERGVRNPSLRHLAQIARALGVSIADLFETTTVDAS